MRKALQRDTAQQYRLHALLVKGGAPKAQGYNIPVTEFPGKAYNAHAPEWIGLHAELACLKSVEDPRGATLYVAGVTWSGNLIKSKPCEFCWPVLEESGLSRVVWHNETGAVEYHNF